MRPPMRKWQRAQLQVASPLPPPRGPDPTPPCPKARKIGGAVRSPRLQIITQQRSFQCTSFIMEKAICDSNIWAKLNGAIADALNRQSPPAFRGPQSAHTGQARVGFLARPGSICWCHDEDRTKGLEDLMCDDLQRMSKLESTTLRAHSVEDRTLKHCQPHPCHDRLITKRWGAPMSQPGLKNQVRDTVWDRCMVPKLAKTWHAADDSRVSGTLDSAPRH